MPNRSRLDSLVPTTSLLDGAPSSFQEPLEEAIEAFLYSMHEGGFITDHDLTVAGKVAWVLTGGDIPSGTWVRERTSRSRTRRILVPLWRRKTLARIQHMLTKGKPLRN